MDITTMDGKTYRLCVITNVEREALVFTHADGTARVAYHLLPTELQSLYFKDRLEEDEIRIRKEEEEKEKHDKEERRQMTLNIMESIAAVFIAIIIIRIALANAGASFALLGLTISVYFFAVYDTTVPGESKYIDGIGPIDIPRVHNQGLLQNRLLGCVGGIAMFATGLVISALKPNQPKD